MQMPIRILYDDGGFRETHGGVSRYFTEMIKRLPSGFEWKSGMVGTANKYLQLPPFNLPPHKQTVHDFIRQTLHGRSFKGVSYIYHALAKIMPEKFPSGELANKIEFTKICKRGDFDILHITHPHPVERYWKRVVGKKPIVATIHDLIPEKLLENQKVITCRKLLLNDASHVIAVSENTKRDLIDFYGVSAEKISVIYHGCNRHAQKNALRNTPDRPYILYVGKRDGYKNFKFFAKATAPILRELDMCLYCTGSEFTEEEYAYLTLLGIVDRTIQRFVPDEEMSSLFANAFAFVYPSSYEGFGIPILDAFQNRCPVVLSDINCFREVAADSALFFNMSDPEELRSCLISLTNPDRRERFMEKGLERVMNFSWDKCAVRTAKLYSQLFS